jgi:hypothetical protein
MISAVSIKYSETNYLPSIDLELPATYVTNTKPGLTPD